MTQLRRTGAMAEHFGVDVHIISTAEAAEIWPLANLDDIIGAAWLPHDGRAEPAQLPRAIGEGARKHGATIHEGVRVLSLLQENGRVTGVRTDRGEVAAEIVVLACGMWTRRTSSRRVLRKPPTTRWFKSMPTPENLSCTLIPTSSPRRISRP